MIDLKKGVELLFKMKSTAAHVQSCEKAMKMDEGVAGATGLSYIIPVLAGLSLGLNLHQSAVNAQTHALLENTLALTDN